MKVRTNDFDEITDERKWAFRGGNLIQGEF